MFTKPMLAATVESVEKLQFPLIATPKFDGIRCLTLPSTEGKRCRAVTRKWKPIPNLHVRNLIETSCPPGLDGELMVAGEFFDVSSGIMSAAGTPDFTYHIFDYVERAKDVNTGYIFRLKALNKLFIDENGLYQYPFLRYVAYKLLYCIEHLTEFEEACLNVGYEGVMMRAPLSSYKSGRSTLNEAKLLKLKRVDQSEGYIVAVFEEEANLNPLEQDAFGYAKRSTHKLNKFGKGRAGGFIVSPRKVTVTDLAWAIENQHCLKSATQKHSTFFSVGSGFTDKMKEDFWNNCPTTRRITYSHQKIGSKSGGKPRFARFKGFRDEAD